MSDWLIFYYIIFLCNFKLLISRFLRHFKITVAKIITFLFGGNVRITIFAFKLRTTNDMSNVSDGLMPELYDGYGNKIIAVSKLSHRRDVALNGHITYVNPLNGQLATERMNVRTMKQSHQQKGMNSKSSTIVRIEAKRERIEDTMFTIAHNSRKDERREARQLERIAFREAKKRK